MAQSTVLTIVALGAGFVVANWAMRKARPDLVVTTNEVPTDTGEAWDQADVVLSTGWKSVTKVNEIEWLVETDDGGHFVTYHPSNPFEYVKQRNV